MFFLSLFQSSVGYNKIAYEPQKSNSFYVRNVAL